MNPGLAFWYLNPTDDGLGWVVRHDGGTSYTVLSYNTTKYGAQPTGTTLTNAYNNAVAYIAARDGGNLVTAASLAPLLRLGLRHLFMSVTSEAKRARLRFAFSGISRLFDLYGDTGGSAAGEIKQMLTNVDVADDSELLSIKTQMLALPQWPS